VDDITSGRARIDALRPIAIEELLGRDAVSPKPDLLGPGIAGACVSVTGAGGSIGSELCRQNLTCISKTRIATVTASAITPTELQQLRQLIVLAIGGL
jgi:FlaA1/EpsC-like NDP-sugar epimerase